MENMGMSAVLGGWRSKSVRVVRLVVNIDRTPYADVHRVVTELGGRVIWRGYPRDTLELKVAIHKKRLRELREKVGEGVLKFEVLG